MMIRRIAAASGAGANQQYNGRSQNSSEMGRNGSETTTTAQQQEHQPQHHHPPAVIPLRQCSASGGTDGTAPYKSSSREQQQHQQQIGRRNIAPTLLSSDKNATIPVVLSPRKVSENTTTGGGGGGKFTSICTSPTKCISRAVNSPNASHLYRAFTDSAISSLSRNRFSPSPSSPAITIASTQQPPLIHPTVNRMGVQCETTTAPPPPYQVQHYPDAPYPQRTQSLTAFSPSSSQIPRGAAQSKEFITADQLRQLKYTAVQDCQSTNNPASPLLRSDSSSFRWIPSYDNNQLSFAQLLPKTNSLPSPPITNPMGNHNGNCSSNIPSSRSVHIIGQQWYG
jgi:hypothetical protein